MASERNGRVEARVQVEAGGLGSGAHRELSAGTETDDADLEGHGRQDTRRPPTDHTAVN